MIEVLVKPLSNEDKIVKNRDKYIIFVKDPADKDKANKKVLKLISKKFKKKALIKKGKTSRNKLIELI